MIGILASQGCRLIPSAQIIPGPAPTNSSTSSAETQQEMAVSERGSISMPAEDAEPCEIKMVKGVVGILGKVGSGLCELEWSTLSHT